MEKPQSPIVKILGLVAIFAAVLGVIAQVVMNSIASLGVIALYVIAIITAVTATILNFINSGSRSSVPEFEPDTDLREAVEPSVTVETTKSPRQASSAGFIFPVIVATIVVLVSAVSIGTSLAKASLMPIGSSSVAEQVQQDFYTNELTSETVYQQQVSALWAVKDLTYVVADNTSDIGVLASNLYSLQSALMWAIGGIMALLAILIGVVASIGRHLIKQKS